ncbi:sodium:solute symporter [Roseivirga sp. BDSF3-8]|uniref:sodium:solute symporter n=1 Tax=Roseivirga sp. BDSF3-8 TaxID=3241598 RepID=UPI0035319BA8
MFELSTLDKVVIGIYFLIVFGIAWWATYKEKVNASSSDYFLGGRNLGWFVIGASLFASNIGSEHLIGLAGTGASSGVAVSQFEILAGIALLLLGWVFVPFYIKSGVYTMPEFLERRYDGASRMYLSIISIVGYVLTKISVTIAAGGIVFTVIGVDFWTGALIIVIATGIYTIFGGLKAVLYTDMIQMFVLIGGAIAVTYIGLEKLGGWNEMTSIVGPSFMSMWRPTDHPDFPWTGIMFGAPILGIWYWCTDQFIVQRVLSAKNVSEARKGTIFGGFLKMTPLFIFVVPGIIAYALSQKGLLSLEAADQALPVLIQTLLPSGLVGLVIAGLLAALMSSLSSVFNSTSTLFTLDIYKRFEPNASERKLVVVGQIATAVLVVVGLLWIPFMKYISGQIFTYLQSVQAYIAPPITAVFLFGLFFKRLNATGSIAALLSGLVLGAIRFITEVLYNLEKISLEEGSFMHGYATMNFLHFAIVLFIICVIVLIAVSMATAPPPAEKVEGITYDRKAAKTAETGKGTDIALSILLAIIIIGLWIYFS